VCRVYWSEGQCVKGRVLSVPFRCTTDAVGCETDNGYRARSTAPTPHKARPYPNESPVYVLSFGYGLAFWAFGAVEWACYPLFVLNRERILRTKKGQVKVGFAVGSRSGRRKRWEVTSYPGRVRVEYRGPRARELRVTIGAIRCNDALHCVRVRQRVRERANQEVK